MNMEQTKQIQPIERHIEHVMRWFDFDKVYRVMVALDWKWSTGAGMKRPTIDELKDNVIRLMNEVYPQGVSRATGGFMVQYDREDDVFEVAFIVTDCDTYYIDPIPA